MRACVVYQVDVWTGFSGERSNASSCYLSRTSRQHCTSDDQLYVSRSTVRSGLRTESSQKSPCGYSLDTRPEYWRIALCDRATNARLGRAGWLSLWSCDTPLRTCALRLASPRRKPYQPLVCSLYAFDGWLGVW